LQKIPLVCVECKLAPDTTIRGLLKSDDDYAFGSFAAIVSGCHQNNHQYEMYVKDGERSYDTATVSIKIQIGLLVYMLNVFFYNLIYFIFHAHMFNCSQIYNCFQSLLGAFD